MIRVSDPLKGTQVETAVGLLTKFVKEDNFWNYLALWVKGTNLSEHDLLEVDAEILAHLKFMFSCDLNIEVRSYRTANPLSTVIGYSTGNRTYENMWKINKFTLQKRTGHLGHEFCHLFGYHHQYQGQKTSVAVVFGKCLEAYAETRIKEMGTPLSA